MQDQLFQQRGSDLQSSIQHSRERPALCMQTFGSHAFDGSALRCILSMYACRHRRLREHADYQDKS